jgi:Carboxypeptidase regulatory-like domain/TonB dependent receptor
MASKVLRFLGPVLLVFLPLVVSAQQGSATLQGSVVDESGGVLPGVAVAGRNEETGVVRSTVTDSVGHYRLPAISTGLYTIRVELAGFSTEERKGVRLVVGQEVTVDFAMKVSTVAETVTVTGVAPLVDTQRSQVSATIEEKQIQDLPLLSRNFLALAALVPGAGRNTSITGTQPLQIGGADSRYNYTTIIDGGDIDDDIWGAPVQSFIQDSIKEFQVITNRFDAEYGKALEAVLNVVSKSGTNALTGSGFGFFRDDKFKAKNYFEQVKPPFNQKRAGGTIGGPIVLNKTHFFGAYEYVNANRPLTVAIPSASPLSQYDGTFPATNVSHLVSGRVDHQLSATNSLMVRALYEHNASQGGFGGTAAQSTGVTTARTSYSILGQETATLGSHLVNDFRFQFRLTDVNAIPNSLAPTEIHPSGTIGAVTYYSQEARHRNQFYDTVYFTLPHHNIKLGGELTFMDTQYCACAEQPGLFVFATDAPYNPANPATAPTYFEQSINPASTPLPDKYFGLFVQDDWRLNDRLTVNLGIRWDVDLRVRDNQTMEAAFALPRNQSLMGVLDQNPGVNLGAIDPRVGFAYSPSSRTVVRGGAGIYHSRARMFMQELALQQLTANGFFAVVTDPQRLKFYPDINAILGSSPAQFASTAPRAMSNVIANDFQLPYAVDATLGFTRQFGETMGLNVDAIYAHTLHSFEKRVLNLPDSFSPSNPAGTAKNPYKYGFGRIQEQVTDGEVWYYGLVVGLNKRFSDRYQGQVSYTLSKATQLGANTHYYTPSQAVGGIDKGPTLNDMRNKLSVTGTVMLPLGLQASTVVIYNDGQPYEIRAGIDLDGDGTTIGDRPAGLALNQGGTASQANLDIINAFRQGRGLSTVTLDQLGQRYNYLDFDARLTKIVKLSGARSVELMAEAFNLFNRVNFNNPNGILTSSTFLQTSSTGSGREGQFGVRFRF